MKTTIDSAGRLVVPKVLRDRLGLKPGSTVDVSAYGAGLQLVAVGRTARVRTIRGEVVAESETVITDEDVFALLDADRR
ncbi:MAG TPA: AbrB/MazE/SpoVT family DNA-binding domain-containing protein [Acidimicrobiales bacterium]|jgi:AbrB family looped-hinge helix DNA binding protein|nr:AbrB/MazE/SpoVT family DNA-binding domain-containing protein [Acidimicrobiales bacterium]HMS87838.1 AbrB/MazE/SpoVT family DNA-binding domain-containing protein [Acidimicrobiales bacterium]HRA33852.1 AbrB/MazE/SpoVT family DNA-binding domain-containing protein [Acidimicrobiales bacterium]